MAEGVKVAEFYLELEKPSNDIRTMRVLEMTLTEVWKYWIHMGKGR